MEKSKFSPKKEIARASLILSLILQAGFLLTACGGQNTLDPKIASNSPQTNQGFSFAQLVDYLPDTGSTYVSYNNYASIFSLYGITPESYTTHEPDSKIQVSNGYTPTLLQSAFSNLKPSGASNFTAQNDQVKAFGWSRFQVSTEIYTELGGNGLVTVKENSNNNQKSNSGEVKYDQVYLLRGRFDLKAIDTALIAKGYQKEQNPTGTVYSIGKDGSIDPRASVFEFRIGFDNIGVLADGSAVVASGYKQPVLAALQSLAANQSQPGPTLGQNPAVKALAATFGQAQMVTVFDIHADPEIDNLGKYDFRNLSNLPDKKARAVQLAKELPAFPAAKMGGLAYYEPNRGERYYTIASYYETADQARQAYPAIEKLVKAGYPFNTGGFYGGRDYNSYMTVVESRQTDNLVVFKLKLANDTILFAPSSLDYPFSLFKA